jgi:AraC family transcriptional regulator, arabinose operon regulatory protein
MSRQQNELPHFLDIPMIRTHTGAMTIAEGFAGQRMRVLPRPRVREALASPGTARLLVTDCGYFPEAASHGRSRPNGTPQAVLLVCTKGAGWCQTPEGVFAIEAGQAAVLPAGSPHSYGTDDLDPWTLWWLHLDGADLPELLSAGASHSPVRALSDVYRVVALANEALQWMERDTTTASLLGAAGAAWHLLALLAADPPVGHARSDTITRAAAQLRDHPDEHIGVDELAAMAALSPSHFAALFRAQIGSPVLQYQTQLRMARARELLDTTERSIADVAAASGYPDSFYFSRQFKKVHGMTPFRYRAQHKG